MNGYPIHGEAYIDGDASGGVAMILYIAGSVTVRALASTEVLHITDIFVNIEAGGDFSVVADSDAAGRRILEGNVAMNGGVDKHYATPNGYACPAGVVPKLFGASTGGKRNSCIIEGFILEA